LKLALPQFVRDEAGVALSSQIFRDAKYLAVQGTLAGDSVGSGRITSISTQSNAMCRAYRVEACRYDAQSAIIF